MNRWKFSLVVLVGLLVVVFYVVGGAARERAGWLELVRELRAEGWLEEGALPAPPTADEAAFARGLEALLAAPDRPMPAADLAAFLEREEVRRLEAQAAAVEFPSARLIALLAFERAVLERAVASAAAGSTEEACAAVHDLARLMGLLAARDLADIGVSLSARFTLLQGIERVLAAAEATRLDGFAFLADLSPPVTEEEYGAALAAELEESVLRIEAILAGEGPLTFIGLQQRLARSRADLAGWREFLLWWQEGGPAPVSEKGRELKGRLESLREQTAEEERLRQELLSGPS